MSGSWHVLDGSAAIVGRPWLVLRGSGRTAVLRGGSVLELHERGVRALGPDILAKPPDYDAMLANLRRVDQRRAVGEALLDQRLVSGIGNLWRAEALWQARLSPWLLLQDVTDEELVALLRGAARLMGASLETAPGERVVYRRAGRPCPRCGETIRAHGQGDANRTAYWCTGCQRGNGPRLT
jgi:endonuclease-8